MTTNRRIVVSNRRVPSMKKVFGSAQPEMEMPNLIDMPRRSYERFLRENLRELFDEISPIEDFTGGRMELRFGDYRFEDTKYTETECRDRERTYASPLRVRVELLVKESGEVKEQEIFMGDIPMMTTHGTFIIN
ncbi:MAG: DNA-directed RNA polymerase subunit beta, partial [Dehalococcoidia bacterium]|nr:DNA-directed RNA polymerase subunit beta [Dehalococcoidia bacterium]